MYITGLLNRDNKFLHCNCNTTGESITLFRQENTSFLYKFLFNIFNHIQYTKILFFFLAFTNLRYKNYTSFYNFFLLLSIDLSLDPGLNQRSPDISSTIWELLNKKGLNFLHININSLLSKKDEIRCIANKTKAAIIGITESKLDHTVPVSEITFKNMIFSDVIEVETVVLLLVTLGRISASTQRFPKKLKILFLTFFYLGQN